MVEEEDDDDGVIGEYLGVDPDGQEFLIEEYENGDIWLNYGFFGKKVDRRSKDYWSIRKFIKFVKAKMRGEV